MIGLRLSKFHKAKHLLKFALRLSGLIIKDSVQGQQFIFKKRRNPSNRRHSKQLRDQYKPRCCSFSWLLEL